MKSQSFKLFVATLVIGLFTVGSAFAQGNLSFNIPFDFQVGKHKLESGKYEMQRLDNSKFILKNVETNSSTIVITSGSAGTDSTKIENLIFNRYGETYFLRQVFAVRGTAGRETGESKAESKIRKNLFEDEPKLAKNKENFPEKVSINSAH